MRYLALSAILALAGCAGIHPVLDRGIPTTWTYDSVKHVAYYDRRDLLTFCVDHHGVLTHDKAACMIQARKLCIYATAPYDKAHDRELNALCNGWRPKLVIG